VIQEFVILVPPALPVQPGVRVLPSPHLLNGQTELCCDVTVLYCN